MTSSRGPPWSIGGHGGIVRFADRCSTTCWWPDLGRGCFSLWLFRDRMGCTLPDAHSRRGAINSSLKLLQMQRHVEAMSRWVSVTWGLLQAA